METIEAEFKENSLDLPTAIGERLGWKPGTKLLIETRDRDMYLRPQELSAKDVARLAGIYLVKYVGDATDVKAPIRVDGKWRVEVVLSYRPQTVGFLTFSPDGQLIENESTALRK